MKNRNTSGGSWCASPQDDRAIRAVAEPPVDPLDDGVDAVRDRLVLGNRRAAGRGELDEREDALVLGMRFEQPLDRQQALLDALRVVEPIDADADPRVGAQPELGEELLAALRRRRRGLRPAVGPVDRDRVRAHQRAHAAVDDGVELAVDARFEEPVHGVEEVVAVELRVEAEDAAAQQAVEHGLGPRADPQPLEVGPGDVPEGDDRGLRQLLADHPRRQREVIVLHEDDRVVGVDFLDGGLGELAVHRLVLRPVLRAEYRPRVRDVTQRPQAFVGEAVVVAALFLLGQPDAAQQIGVLSRRHVNVIARVDGLAIGRAAAVRDPDAGARAHHRLERGDQPRGRMTHDDPAVGVASRGCTARGWRARRRARRAGSA